MNLHIHIGPANHQKILLNQLRRNDIDHNWTNYYPRFEYGNFLKEKGNTTIPVHQKYDLLDKVLLGLRSRVSFLRKTNWHLDVLFPSYDKAASKLINSPTTLFAWPMVSREMIKKVNKTGGVSILDYPIAHISSWQRTLQEEARLFRSKVSPRSLFTSRMWEYMLEEIEEAQFINVPSRFVWDTFIENGVPEEKLLLNNYGVDDSLFFPSIEKEDNFTIVYVGSIELRKGVHYLVEAFHRLNLRGAQVKIIGDIKDDYKSCFPEHFKMEGINWMGYCTPEQTAEELMRSHVLVMPSVMEGQSLTILEAQACGLPVIASENTGGGDVIRNGYNGFIYPNRDVDSLCTHLLSLYENRDLIVEMGRNSQNVFQEHFTATAYGKRIIKMLKGYMTSRQELYRQHI